MRAISMGLAVGLVAAAARAEPPSSADRVREAWRSGQLDARSAALWDVVAALAPERLPRALSGARASHPRELSLSLRNARLQMDRLSPSERTLLSSLLLRPTDPGGEFGFSVPEATPYCSDNFCVHYVTTTSDAPSLHDLDQSGTPDPVEETAQQLEIARIALIGLGYSYHGIDDGGLGGDTRLDVYIKDVGNDFTAAVVPEDIKEFSPVRLSSYMIVNTQAFGLPPDYFGGVMSHELKHTFDAATFGNAPSWLFESSAVWVQNEVDDADTTHTVFFPCWYTWPELSVDVTRETFYPPGSKDPGNCGAAPYHIYGSATFWFQLGAELGAVVNREVWDQGGLACANGTDPDSSEMRRCVADTIAKVASDGGKNLTELFVDFSVKNYRPRKSTVLLSIESGGELFAWPDAPHIESKHTSYPAEGQQTLDHWSSRYYEFMPITGSRPLEVSVDGPDAVSFGATLVVTQNDAISELPIALDGATNQGKATVEAFGGSVTRVALVVTNPLPIETNDSSDGLSFSYSASVGEAGASGAGGTAGTGGSAGAAGAAGAAGSAGSNATPSESDDDGGCGCRTARSGGQSGLALLAMLALLWRRRRA